MQANQEYKVKAQRERTTMSLRQLIVAALLTATVLPACSVPPAEAGTEASKGTDNKEQSLVPFTPSAPCHTAPARNNPRKLAAVAGLRQGSRQYYSNVMKSTGTDFAAAILFSTYDGGFDVTDRWTGGDFDGDGDQDLIAVWNNGGATAFAFRQAVGDTFVTSQLPIAPRAWSADTVWIPGDFDNNGRADLAAIFHDGSSTSIDVYLSTSAGFATPQRWMTQGLSWSATTKWSVGDFNGGIDKRDDLVSVRDDGGVSAAVWISSGNLFSGSIWSTVGGWNEYSKYVAGDFTGDGKADLAGLWDNGGNISVAVYPSTGSSFSYPSQWLNSSNYSFYRTGHIVAGYFTSDEKADIAIDWNDYDGVSVFAAFPSNGTSFAASFTGVTGDYWSATASICSGVFNALQ